MTATQIEEFEKFLDENIKMIEDDERYHYPTATVYANAPLALIQMGLSEKMSILKQVKNKLQEYK